MDRFVKSVNNMNSTVLVPSKLRDMDIVGKKGVDNCPSIPPCLANADLYNFYVMLNDVKEELLWGPSSISTVNHIGVGVGDVTAREKSSSAQRAATSRHIRQPSADESLGSLGSTASSSDLETDSETDTFVKERDLDDTTPHLATAFRQHLQALHTILHQFADAADYLSCRYQEEIDSCCF